MKVFKKQNINLNREYDTEAWNLRCFQQEKDKNGTGYWSNLVSAQSRSPLHRKVNIKADTICDTIFGTLSIPLNSKKVIDQPIDDCFQALCICHFSRVRLIWAGFDGNQYEI